MDAQPKFRHPLLLLAAAAVLSACASAPEDPIEREVYLEANDPLEPMNRAIFAFNLKVDAVVLEPAARGYRAVVPQPGRNAIRRFLDNLLLPVVFANDVLQGEPGRAAETLARFTINTTFGILGQFDAAGIEPHAEDFGQTLAVWGVGDGPYLVVPFHGPSNIRDGAGLFADRGLDPFTYWLQSPEEPRFFAARTVAGAVDDRERILEDFVELRRVSVDFYATARSLYRQSRAHQIRNGAPAPVPEFDFDE